MKVHPCLVLLLAAAYAVAAAGVLFDAHIEIERGTGCAGCLHHDSADERAEAPSGTAPDVPPAHDQEHCAVCQSLATLSKAPNLSASVAVVVVLDPPLHDLVCAREHEPMTHDVRVIPSRAPPVNFIS